jgi:hypothetical protein
MPYCWQRAISRYIEILTNIKLAKDISASFWIHETQSAINYEFKMRSIQASSVRPNSPKDFAA